MILGKNLNKQWRTCICLLSQRRFKTKLGRDAGSGFIITKFIDTYFFFNFLFRTQVNRIWKSFIHYYRLLKVDSTFGHEFLTS